MTLKLKIIYLHEPLCHGKTRYFLVFCVVGEVLLVVHGDGVILGLITFYLLFMLLFCYN